MKVRLLLATLCAALGALLLTLPAAAAPAGSSSGTITVKSHGDAIFPPEDDPQIGGCPAGFDLYAYHFEHPQLHWNIVQQPPTGSQVVTAGTAMLMADSPQPSEGARYSGYLLFGNVSLPDGHYEANASEVGGNGVGTHKVFWIKSTCSTAGGGGGTGVGSGQGGDQGAGQQGAVLAASASLGGGAVQGAVLAQTGLPAGGALYGVFLIASGLLLRRRR